MKKHLLLGLGLSLCALSSSGQTKFSGNLEGGLGVPFADLNDNTYEGYKANFTIGAGLGYELDPSSRLRLDLLAGQLNGNNADFFWQAQIYEGSVSYEYNLIHLFNYQSNYKLNFRGGLGAGLATSHLFDINSRQRIAEIPSPGNNRDAFSLQSYVLLGANFGIPLTNKVDFNIGYAQRFLLFQPWLDAFDPNSNDHYGVGTVGFTVYLRSDRDKSKIEVDPNNYQELKQRAEVSAQNQRELEKEKERLARLEMLNQEKEMEIAMLKQDLDSLKANPVVVSGEATPGRGESIKVRSADFDTGEKMFRIVVVSAPSQAGAQKFVERSKLDNSEMKIAYIEQLDTYRVVYKSASTMEEARKYLQEARKYYSDAWIVKF